MTLSVRYADASAATMESAQTGQVGRAQPRGSGLCVTVDRTSAIADIVDPPKRFQPQLYSTHFHWRYRNRNAFVLRNLTLLKFCNAASCDFARVSHASLRATDCRAMPIIIGFASAE